LPDSGAKPVVQIYEDEGASEQDRQLSQEASKSQTSTQAASQPNDLGASQSSDLSEPDEDDPDEENDPIIHSFGPFGANISSRIASFSAGGSPTKTRDRVPKEFSASPAKRSSSESTTDADTLPVVNHVINQLAFSRLSSTPISVILNNLPAALKNFSPSRSENRGLTKDDLHKILVATPCIGEIHREGKDAAGKALESEYYYIPDEDRDAQRRAAVVDGLRKPSLRNCRKQHKVCSTPNIYASKSTDRISSNTTGRSLRHHKRGILFQDGDRRVRWLHVHHNETLHVFLSKILCHTPKSHSAEFDSLLISIEYHSS
jgi:hypothetical protein